MNALIALDDQILLWIQQNLRGPLDDLVISITHLGDSGLLWIILGLFLLLFRKTRRGGFALLLAMLCNFLITNITLKNLVARVRPYEVVEGLTSLLGNVGEWSFPSGHTSSSFAAAVAVAATLGKKLGIPALLLATLIGLSRLYVGVHYPTDVLAGAVIGVVCGLLGAAIVKTCRRKHARR